MHGASQDTGRTEKLERQSYGGKARKAGQEKHGQKCANKPGAVRKAEQWTRSKI
jgi:hypothetical protein